MKVKLRKIGNSLGVILPKEVLARMHAEEGDDLMLAEGPQGVQLSLYDDEVARQVEIGLEVIREYRDVLKALAQ
jgi:putative addiction module antidote